MQVVSIDFTPPAVAGQPATWSFDPNIVTFDAGKTRTISYQTENWNFRAISFANQGDGESQGFVTARGITDHQLSYDWGTLKITDWSDSQVDVVVANTGDHSDQVTLQVVITLGEDSQRQSSRDPQIILRPNEGSTQE